jgi:hypothetical protein
VELTRVVRSLALGCLLGAARLSPLAAQEVPDSIRIPRLEALGRLYTAIRFFHPAPGYLGLELDQVTATAADAIRVADTRDAYQAALTGLLELLDDPRTRIIDGTIPWQADSGQAAVSHRWTQDSVLVVTVLPPPVPASAEVAAGLALLTPHFGRARAIVFDLRGPPGWPELGSVEHAFGQEVVSRALLAVPIGGPGERTRFHEGYQPDRPAQASAVFRQGWHQEAGPVFEGAAGGNTRPIVFVVNGDSELPRFALAARSAGIATIVGEGAASQALGGTVLRLPMGDSLVAQVRVGELVNGDGTVARAVDTVVASGGAGRDPALSLALTLARRPWTPYGAATAPAISPPPPVPDSTDGDFPGPGERLVGLFRLWGAVRYFHAYPELRNGDWEAALARFIPRFEAARDSVEYALAIAELMALTRDSHGGVQAPGLRALWGTAPLPFKARMIAGRPIVTRLAADSLGFGLRLGDELLSIDGEAIGARLARIRRHLAASSEQALGRDALSRALRGRDGAMALLRVRGANGLVRTVRVPWSESYEPLLSAERDGPVLRLLPGGIGYADLDRLNPSDVDSMFRMFRDTRAIIFDMRGYPRETAWEIAPRLTDKDGVAAARFTLPVARRPVELELEEMAAERLRSEFEQRLPPRKAEVYRGRTVMLIDERTQSQAEHTALFFQAANGTTLIGTPSAGANGDVTNVALPGGIVAWFTGLAVTYPDGRALQQVGLRPTIRVAPTLAGIRAGRDEVLEAAIRYLSPARRRQ